MVVLQKDQCPVAEPCRVLENEALSFGNLDPHKKGKKSKARTYSKPALRGDAYIKDLVYCEKKTN